MSGVNPPRAFISYSHDSPTHMEWVLDFAARLQEHGGIQVILDTTHYTRQQNWNTFILKSITDADYTLVIGTSKYKFKADSISQTGVGSETVISIGFFYNNPEKFIPIVRERLPDGSPALPLYLNNYDYYDFSTQGDENDSFERLFAELWRVKRIELPPVSDPPVFKVQHYGSPKSIAGPAIKELLDTNIMKMKREFDLMYGPKADSDLAEFAYVEPKVSNRPRHELNEDSLRLSASKECQEFLLNQSQKIWVLLGEYGSGKTTYCYRLCLELYRASQQAESPHRIFPIYLACRNAAKLLPDEMSEWCNQLLSSEYGSNDDTRFSWSFSIESLKEFMRDNQVLLVLDGLDELQVESGKTSDDNYQTILSFLRALPCKSVVTSRINYFSTPPYVSTITRHLPFASVRPLTVTARTEDVRLQFMIEFDEHDLVFYLNNSLAFQSNAEKLLERIKVDHELAGIAKKPVFVNLLAQLDVSSLKDDDFGILSIYEDIVIGWSTTNRVIPNMAVESIVSFLQELAFFMFVSGTKEIGTVEFDRYLATHFKGMLNQEVLQLNLTTATFILRTSAKTYTFSHNTFIEFLVARKLFGELLNYNNHNFYLKLLSDPINHFLNALIDRHERRSLYEWGDDLNGMTLVREDSAFSELVSLRIPSFYIDTSPITNNEYVEFLQVQKNMVVPMSENRDLLIELVERENVDWVVNNIDGYIRACERFCWDPITRSFPENEGEHPLIYVSYYDAWAYSRWRGKALPSFLEWYKAAAWDHHSQTLQSFAIVDGQPSSVNCNCEGAYGRPTRVGKFPDSRSPYGCVDMTGNVSEWTTDWFDKAKLYKVIAGGSWHMEGADLQTDSPSRSLPNVRRNFVGFRCVSRRL